MVFNAHIDLVGQCVGSVDGLVEASRQSRVCGGAANEIMCAIFRVLMEVSHELLLLLL